MSKHFAWFIGQRYAFADQSGSPVGFLSRISVIGLILGVAVLITVLSVMNGFEQQLEQRILRLVPHTMILSSGPIEEWPTLRDSLERHPEVRATAPYVEMQALLSAGRFVEAAQVQGVDPALEQKLSAIDDYFEQGSLADLPKLEEGRSAGIALGAAMAEKLNVTVGDKVRLIVPDASNSRRKPRLGLFTLRAVFHSGTEIDRHLALIDLAAAQKLMRMGQAVDGVRVQTHNVFEASRISWELIEQLPPGYYARDWRRMHGNLYQAIQMSRRLVGLIIFMVIAVAVFNVIASLVMLVSDKREDIAILKTMGADTAAVRRIFLVHGAHVGVIGTAAGVAIGCVLSLGLPSFIAWLEASLGFKFLDSDAYFINYLPADLRWRDVLTIALTALGMTIAATWYPAARAAKIRPAEALRHEL